MDLSRAVYSRDLKIAAMRALDAGSATDEIARKYQLSPHLLERWRGEWRAKGESAFPGIGRRGADLLALDDARRIAELERKIGQLTMENHFLKREFRVRSGTAPASEGGMRQFLGCKIENLIDAFSESRPPRTYCELYRQWARKLDIVMRQEHRAGETTFVDHAGQTKLSG
jgi:transposase-like protein